MALLAQNQLTFHLSIIITYQSYFVSNKKYHCIAHTSEFVIVYVFGIAAEVKNVNKLFR